MAGFGFPMSPAQAAILGQQRPSPVATVNAPTYNGMPIQPAQMAALGVQPNGMMTPQGGMQPPAQAAPMDPASYLGNPMAGMLLQRGMREEPIQNPISLLGRLAALGVGQSIERKNTEGRQGAMLEAIKTMPPEVQQMARIAIASGVPSEEVMRSMIAASQIGVQREGVQAKVAGDQLNAEVAREGLTLEQQKINQDFDNAVAQREQNAAQFAQSLGVDYAGIAIDAAQQALAEKNSALDEAYRRDALGQEHDLKQAELLAKGLDLNADQRKSLGQLASISTPLEIMDTAFKGYKPTKLTDQLVAQIAAMGDTNIVAGIVKQFMKSSAYEDMDDSEKRFFTTAVSIAENATRRASGAAVTAADLAITFTRLIPKAGDTDQILADKSEQRAAELDAILVGLPDAAVKALAAKQAARQ